MALGLGLSLGLTSSQGGIPWILASGLWNDKGVWDDAALWID